MARLDYGEFKEYCTKNLLTVLGVDKYEAVSRTILESDEVEIDSVEIKEKGSKAGPFPSFRVQPLYKDYCDGKSLGQVMLKLLNTIEWFIDNTPSIADTSIFDAFDNAKDNLIIRPISYSYNKKILQDFVYKQHGDVAVVLYMLMHASSESMGTAKVPKPTVEQWGMDESFLLRTALENTAALFPPHLVPMEVAFRGADAISILPDHRKYFMNPLVRYSPTPSRLDTYYLSVDKSINGAAAIFYPGVLERITALYNDDLHISLPCITEALIHPVSKSDTRKLGRAAKSMFTQMDIGERLSSSIYYYSRSEKELRMLDGNR